MIPAFRENFGWRIDLERSEILLRSNQRQYGIQVVRERPKVVDPRGWLRIENQGQTSSCVGHATSTAAEMLMAFQSGGKTDVQLSRWQAYISAQMEDKLLGRDQGATITGTVRAAEKRGICLESECPFTGRYFQEVPQQAWVDAETRQIKAHVQIHSHREAVDWIGGGMGAVIVGVPVDERFMANRGETIDRVPSSGGGHAMAIVGYLDDGRLILPNSWGDEWGSRGFGLVSEEGFNAWCRMTESSRAEVWGISDMETPKPRTFSVDEWVEALLPKFD